MRELAPIYSAATPARLRSTLLAFLALILAIAAAATVASAQEEATDSAAKQKLFNSIQWVESGDTGRVGTVGILTVPEGCRFTEAAGARTFMILTENVPSGQEVGALYCGTPETGNPEDVRHWFVTYDYDPSGYVRDDEKSSLDAGKMLTSLREGQSDANEERRKRGWDELTLDGWLRAPYYDESTHNLTWALRILSPGDTTINHSVRLLGRRGVLKVDLVSGPQTFERALPVFNRLITSTTFVSGQKYSEWRSGDKVAEYGLTALVAGGAGAAAMKLGLFGKLWKVIASVFVAAWKLIAVAAAAVATKFKKLFGRKEKTAPTAPTP